VETHASATSSERESISNRSATLIDRSAQPIYTIQWLPITDRPPPQKKRQDPYEIPQVLQHLYVNTVMNAAFARARQNESQRVANSNLIAHLMQNVLDQVELEKNKETSTKPLREISTKSTRRHASTPLSYLLSHAEKIACTQSFEEITPTLKPNEKPQIIEVIKGAGQLLLNSIPDTAPAHPVELFACARHLREIYFQYKRQSPMAPPMFSCLA
jgi:hypothetical protein